MQWEEVQALMEFLAQWCCAEKGKLVKATFGKLVTVRYSRRWVQGADRTTYGVATATPRTERDRKYTYKQVHPRAPASRKLVAVVGSHVS